MVREPIDCLEVVRALFESRAKDVRLLPATEKIPLPTRALLNPESGSVHEFQQVKGSSETVLGAIDDWYRQLPAGPLGTIVWRWSPTIDRTDDIATKKTCYRVYARFAIIPE